MFGGWNLAGTLTFHSGTLLNFGGMVVTGDPHIANPGPNGWFDTSVFIPVAGFGGLGRNVVTGPGFSNTDFSIIKRTDLGDRLHIELRAEVFDLFNHANLGQPGAVVGSPAFGRIVNTRFPTGESGSSRQVQLGIKLAL